MCVVNWRHQRKEGATKDYAVSTHSVTILQLPGNLFPTIKSAKFNSYQWMSVLFGKYTYCFKIHTTILNEEYIVYSSMPKPIWLFHEDNVFFFFSFQAIFITSCRTCVMHYVTYSFYTITSWFPSVARVYRGLSSWTLLKLSVAFLRDQLMPSIYPWLRNRCLAINNSSLLVSADESYTRCRATARLEHTYFFRYYGPMGRMPHFSLRILFLTFIQSGKRGKWNYTIHGKIVMPEHYYYY
jgi:hypothetical protein